MQFEWALAGGEPLHIHRQFNRQVGFRNGHGAAVRAVNDGNGRAPIALARDQPITQPIAHRTMTDALFLNISNRPLKGDLARRSRQRSGVDHLAHGRDSHCPFIHDEGVLIRGLDDHDDWQVVLAGKFKVALIMGGHRHDRAGAIPHHHIIGCPHRDPFTVNRVDGVSAGEHTGLFTVSSFALDFAHALSLGSIFRHGWRLLGCGELFHQWMFRRQHHEGCSPQGVRSGSENLNLIAIFSLEHDRGALRAVDPVGLQGLNLLWPVDR